MSITLRSFEENNCLLRLSTRHLFHRTPGSHVSRSHPTHALPCVPKSSQNHPACNATCAGEASPTLPSNIVSRTPSPSNKLSITFRSLAIFLSIHLIHVSAVSSDVLWNSPRRSQLLMGSRWMSKGPGKDLRHRGTSIRSEKLSYYLDRHSKVKYRLEARLFTDELSFSRNDHADYYYEQIRSSGTVRRGLSWWWSTHPDQRYLAPPKNITEISRANL